MRSCLTPSTVVLFVLILTSCNVGDLAERVLNQFNNVEEGDPAVRVSRDSRRYHDSLFIVDLHADPLVSGRDLLQKSGDGHVDIPRLIEGNVALQVFSVFTKTPVGVIGKFNVNEDGLDVVSLLAVINKWPYETQLNTPGGMHQRALYQAARLDAFAQASGGRFRIIRGGAGLRAYVQQRDAAGLGPSARMTAGLLALEGADAVGSDTAKLDSLVAGLETAGFRMIGLVHFHDNAIGGSAHGRRVAQPECQDPSFVSRNKERCGGLTDFGRSVIRLMARYRMIVDLAHASEVLIDDVLALIDSFPAGSGPPIAVSHTGVKGTCDNERNLSDKHLKDIIDKEGLIGIGFFKLVVCAKPIDEATSVEDIVAAFLHIKTVIDTTYNAPSQRESAWSRFALGSDWDGTVTVPMDPRDLAKLTHVLLAELGNTDRVKGIMGGNARAFLERVLLP